MNKMRNYLTAINYDADCIELACHGFEILKSDAVNFLLINCVGFFTNSLLHSLLFYLLFGFLRVSTGGYHCISKLRCHLTYLSLFIVFLYSKDSFYFMNIPVSVSLTSLSVIFIIMLSPVQHLHNPLSNFDIRKNRKDSRWKVIIFFITYLLLLSLANSYYKLFSVILIYDALLIILHMTTQYYIMEGDCDGN